MLWYVGDVPVVERSHALVFVGFFFTTLAAFTAGMRAYTRAFLVRNLGIDDVLMCIAVVGSIAFLTAAIFQVKFGLGDAVRLDRLQSFLQSLYATVVAYGFTQLTIKFSILFQYKRIFGQTPAARKVVIGLLVWLSVYAAFCLGTSIITCWPVEKYWDATIPGACIDRSNLHYAIAGFNILNDLTLLIFPMPFLRHLHVTFRAKLVLVGVFACGGFACIVAIIRLQSLYVNNSAPIDQQPIQGVDIAVWSGLEINVAIICASVPALKALFVKIIPKLASYNLSKRTGYARSGTNHTNSLRLRTLDNNLHAGGSKDDVESAAGHDQGMRINVHKTFEAKTIPVSDDDSEKNLVATSWMADCSSHDDMAGAPGQSNALAPPGLTALRAPRPKVEPGQAW